MRATTRTAHGIDYVEELAAAVDRFADALDRCDLRRPVPACPGWSTYDLVTHLGNVYGWAATVVETGQSTARQDDEPGSHRRRAVTAWYAGKAEDLYAVLRACDPERACWTFALGQGTAGFWLRRMVHETLVHLVDLDQAAGRTTSLAPALSADGVAEVLAVFVPLMHRRGRLADLVAPLSLVCSDTGHTWTLMPHEGRPPAVAVRPEAVVQPATVQGGGDRVEAAAGTLLRLLWQRATLDDADVEVSGDRERVGAFLASPLTP